MSTREFTVPATLSCINVAREFLKAEQWRFTDCGSGEILYRSFDGKIWVALLAQNGMLEIDKDYISAGNPQRIPCAITYRFMEKGAEIWLKQSSPISTI